MSTRSMGRIAWERPNPSRLHLVLKTSLPGFSSWTWRAKVSCRTEAGGSSFRRPMWFFICLFLVFHCTFYLIILYNRFSHSHINISLFLKSYKTNVFLILYAYHLGRMSGPTIPTPRRGCWDVARAHRLRWELAHKIKDISRVNRSKRALLPECHRRINVKRRVGTKMISTVFLLQMDFCHLQDLHQFIDWYIIQLPLLQENWSPEESHYLLRTIWTQPSS